MAGLQGRVELINGLRKHNQTAEKLVTVHASEAMLEAVVEAVATAREVVATTPSSLSRVPKNNRIWTGAMIAALDGDVKITGTTITGRVGWLNVKEDYFLVQEHGGQVREIRVTPMNALSAAQAVIVEKLASEGIR
jgi:hypothetical protein